MIALASQTRRAPPELLWLSAGLLLAAAPHAAHLPVWIPALLLLSALWRIALCLLVPNLAAKPGLLLRLIYMTILLSAVFGIYGGYGTLVGRDAGVALLLVLTGFKLLETRAPRDIFVSCCIGFFITVTNFFYTQTVLTAAYMLAVVIVLTATLMELNDSGHRIDVAGKLRYTGALIVQATPIMLVAFVLFPRISGPLWGLPNDAYSGLTGLDDEMIPGSISELSQSDAVAFRVEFDGPIPEQARLYWRGPVLWDTDGRKWTRGQTRVKGLVEVRNENQPLRYTLTLEPQNKNWVYALDMPGEPPANTRLTRDLQLLADKPLRGRTQFELLSYPFYRLIGADAIDLERGLALPPGQHPRAVALARGWRKRGLGFDEIINEALRMFHEQNFYYTMHPPLMAGDAIDQFLFETREGFCEHYAAAFAVLMRAAGLPARIVTGYQGGSFNPFGGYLIVRQQDAHAWVEVWLGERGWVRVDPTAAVSPERIREGIETALPRSVIDIPFVLERGSFAIELWRRLRFAWDALNNQWNQWVLGYGERRQKQLLRALGMKQPDWRELALWLLGAVVTLLVGIALWLFTRRPPAEDAARRLYDRFCAKLERAGLKRHPAEGPRDFGTRAAAQVRHLADAIREITELYIRIRYGRGGELRQLRARVRAFRPA